MLVHVNAIPARCVFFPRFLLAHVEYTDARHESTVGSPCCSCRQLHVLLPWVFCLTYFAKYHSEHTS